jgi:polyvinyl alcohol dehydrogenase (cytochrome)
MRLRLLASAFALGATALLASCTTAADQQADGATQTAAAVPAGPHPGEAIYNTRCAACHNNPEGTKAPPRETLARMSPGQITNSLIAGMMAPQAVGLSSKDVSDISNYLGLAEQEDDSWTTAMKCPASRARPKLDVQPTVATFGFDQSNQRRLDPAKVGLAGKDLTTLELAWTIAFPKAITMRSQAAVVGNTLFLPVGESNNRLFAFDISDNMKPCIQWIYEGDQTLRTSAGYGVRQDGKKVVMVGDLGGVVHLIDAMNGKKLWAEHMGLFPGSISTGTPVLVGDKVIAPSSQYEIMMASQDSHECCKIHGGVVAMDAMTGKRVWEGHTMENAKPIKDRGDGKMIWGPSGAPVWNSPSIDQKRGLIFVGTGEANSAPAHKNTNAIMAFSLKDGSIKWAHQATPDDVFNVGCNPRGGPKNCPREGETVFRDVDFGASTIIAKAPNGKELVLAGQKSGTVWAMNPDTGKVEWRRDIGTGGPNGGIHWGIAADDTHVYAPISYIGRSIPGQEVSPDLKPGLYAVNLNDGSMGWQFQVAPDCTDARKKFVPRCNGLYGLSGAPTVIGDHIITGGLDGRVYMLEKKTGKLVWTFDTAREFEALNGVKGNGGSFDNASIVAANGLVLMNSGYGLFGQGAGNVMIALKPKS